MLKLLSTSKNMTIIKHSKLRARKPKTANSFAAIPAALPRQWHSMTQIKPQLISALKTH